MALFRKKQKEATVSAFDQIPIEAQAQLIEDIMSIVRTFRQWPKIVPKDLHDGIGKELMAALRKGGLKMAGIVMSDDEPTANDLSSLLSGIELPNFAKQVIAAVAMAWNTPDPVKLMNPPTEGNDDGTKT